jgi:lipopolysaccharide heptosyltransferase I
MKVLIVRLGSLGDVIHGIPVAAALRSRYPQARIDWLVDRRYVELLDLVESLDSRIPFDPRELPGGSARRTLRDLRAMQYDAVIDLQGLLKSAVIARLVAGKRTIGFPRQHLREPMARFFYTDTPDVGDARHVIDKNLRLLSAVGITDAAVHFPIRIPRLSPTEITSGSYAILNPGAAWPNKRWPPDRFGAVAAAMQRDLGLRSIVLWGPGEESLAAAVVDASQGAAESAPRTQIADLVGLARDARVMISGDTGPLHIAGAVGTPLVALFGPTSPERNGPWSPRDVVISRVSECACLYERGCRKSTPCINAIAVEQVLDGVRRCLAAHG